jgi:hypothetical protein
VRPCPIPQWLRAPESYRQPGLDYFDDLRRNNILRGSPINPPVQFCDQNFSHGKQSGSHFWHLFDNDVDQSKE